MVSSDRYFYTSVGIWCALIIAYRRVEIIYWFLWSCEPVWDRRGRSKVQTSLGSYPRGTPLGNSIPWTAHRSCIGSAAGKYGSTNIMYANPNLVHMCPEVARKSKFWKRAEHEKVSIGHHFYYQKPRTYIGDNSLRLLIVRFKTDSSQGNHFNIETFGIRQRLRYWRC